MYRRHNRLLLVILPAVVFALILGCSQSEDIIAPISTTEIHMSPVQLPTPPAGYIYELWIVDTADSHISLGKFYWDNKYYRFLDQDSNLIDPVWTTDYDILDPYYRFLAVSIETVPDIDTIAPGPIMLLDTIIDPETSPMEMVFPIDFGLSIAGFCLETPTDKNSQSRDACGVWFALYVYDSVALVDTISVELKMAGKVPRTLEIDTSYWDCEQYVGTDCVESTNVTDEVILNPDYIYDWMAIDTTNLDELAITLDTLGIKCIKLYDSVFDSTLLIDYVTDTFILKMMDFEFVAFPVNIASDTLDTFAVDTCLDETLWFSIAPFIDYIHNLSYGTQVTTDTLDKFLPNYEELPDLYGTKWHYKGWVISPYLPSDCPDLGRLTKPVWLGFYTEQVFGNPDQWPIVSTGTFKSFEHADDANPYSDVLRVPDFPGEDFIQNLPCGADSFYFADQSSPYESIGEIFITIEPDGYDENTNFPLILMSTRWHIPSYREVSSSIVDHVQSRLLLNRAGRVEDNPFGFPGINVILVRE